MTDEREEEQWGEAASNPAAVLELIRQRDAALGGLGLFMDAVDRPPERNCSCHIYAIFDLWGM